MYLKKRKYVIVALALLIAVAVYLNVAYTDSRGMFDITETVSPQKSLGEAAMVDISEGDPALEAGAKAGGQASAADTAISNARLNRQKSRDEAVSLLREVAENPSLASEKKIEAADSLTKIAHAIEKEAAVESLVSAKGFGESVAYISGDAITLTIKADGLLKNQVAQIKDIIITETGIQADKIKILEIK